MSRVHGRALDISVKDLCRLWSFHKRVESRAPIDSKALGTSPVATAILWRCVIAWWRWGGTKTWHFMTPTVISFWPLKMCVYWPERRNVKRVMKVKYFHSVIGPPCGLNWGVCPPLIFFVSGMPVLTTTCSVRTWSTAKSILTSISTSFTPAMCGDSGMWFRATLRRISSPIPPHLAS